MEDTTTFGSFIDSFLTSFREGFSKVSVLNFNFLAGCTPGRVQVDDIRERRKALNDALFLRSMDELAVFNVPIQSPSSWPIPLIEKYHINVSRSFPSAYDGSIENVSPRTSTIHRVYYLLK